jgi:hypothetical protein
VSEILGILLVVVGYFWFFLGFVYYRVHSYAYLANHKTLGGQVTFTAKPSTGEILKTVILGGIAIGLIGGIAFAILGGLVAASFSAGGMGMGPNAAFMIPIVIAYLLILVALAALALVMITQPIIAHLVTTLHVNNTEALAGIRQRVSDTGADADGFADALDVGGAI